MNNFIDTSQHLFVIVMVLTRKQIIRNLWLYHLNCKLNISTAKWNNEWQYTSINCSTHVMITKTTIKIVIIHLSFYGHNLDTVRWIVIDNVRLVSFWVFWVEFSQIDQAHHAQSAIPKTTFALYASVNFNVRLSMQLLVLISWSEVYYDEA